MSEESPEQKPTHADRLRPGRTKSKLTLDQNDALAWLGYEAANVARDAELRIKDATEFVTEYARGRMSPEEFKKRDNAYMFRWGDALKGVADSRGMSDEAVLKDIDGRREEQVEAELGRNRRSR